MFNFNYNGINRTQNEPQLPSCESVLPTPSFQEQKKVLEAKKEEERARKINLDNHFQNLTWGQGTPDKNLRWGRGISNPFIAKHSATQQPVVVRQNLVQGNNQTQLNEGNPERIRVLSVLPNTVIAEKQSQSQGKNVGYPKIKIHASKKFPMQERTAEYAARNIRPDGDNQNFHVIERDPQTDKMEDTSKKSLNWHHKLF